MGLGGEALALGAGSIGVGLLPEHPSCAQAPDGDQHGTDGEGDHERVPVGRRQAREADAEVDETAGDAAQPSQAG